jgi:hypothetical protein
MSGLFLSSRNLYLMLGGAAATLALKGLGRYSDRWRPAAVSTVKEGIAFKEWLATGTERFKEELDDLVAEAAVAYQTEEASDETVEERERKILEQLSQVIDERLGRTGGAKGGKS